MKMIAGPKDHSINKVLHGTYHQGNKKFGETVGIQCPSNDFYAICFLVLKHASTRAYFDLDYIIDHSNNLLLIKLHYL